jgi:hypothetical protein
MYGNLPAATIAAKCSGAFTNTPSVAQDFFTAGIPIWFCQPIQSSQLWHAFLATDLSLPAKSNTKLAMRLQMIYDILSPAMSAPEVKPNETEVASPVPGVVPPKRRAHFRHSFQTRNLPL